MHTVEKKLRTKNQRLIVSFDLEWTKNYRVKDGNVPFCYSFVYFDPSIEPTKLEDILDFGCFAQYIHSKEEIPLLLKNANAFLGDLMQNNNTIIGHQLSSDISVIIRSKGAKDTGNFLDLKNAWSNRNNKKPTQGFQVFDTRYDLGFLLSGKSRRLVDVCEEFYFEVTQPEINNSMTKMQNTFYETGDSTIMEKLAVLNLRHSLSAGLLYYFYLKKSKPGKRIFVNNIIYGNLKSSYKYVRQEEFKRLLMPRPVQAETNHDILTPESTFVEQGCCQRVLD